MIVRNKKLIQILSILIFILIISNENIKLYASIDGGMGLYDENGDYKCTAGYNVTSNDNEQFLMTAGHCFMVDDEVFNESGTKIGISEDVLIDPDENIDYGYIDLDDNTYNPYIMDNGTVHTPVISEMNSPIEQGETVYMYSSLTNYTYEFISIYKGDDERPKGQTFYYKDYNVDGKPQVDGGASGSPVFRYVNGGIELVGILSETNGPYIYITPTYQINNEFHANTI